MICIRCPHCEKVVGYQEADAGVVVACPFCRKLYFIPPVAQQIAVHQPTIAAVPPSPPGEEISLPDDAPLRPDSDEWLLPAVLPAEEESHAKGIEQGQQEIPLSLELDSSPDTSAPSEAITSSRPHPTPPQEAPTPASDAWEIASPHDVLFSPPAPSGGTQTEPEEIDVLEEVEDGYEEVKEKRRRGRFLDEDEDEPPRRGSRHRRFD